MIAESDSDRWAMRQAASAAAQRVSSLPAMPVRKTIRGQQRTPLDERRDVLICGASFAGLAAARQLAGARADVLVVDRYEIGERQTSACGIPTRWLTDLGLGRSECQRFDSLLIHTPRGSTRLRLPWSFSTFDYRTACELLWDQCDADFEFAKVEGRAPSEADGDEIAVMTDRGLLRSPLVVDALGWRRVLSASGGYQPPDAPLSRGLEVHPGGDGSDMEVWIDRRYIPAGYGWSFPAGDEVRVGVGSFEPRDHVREPTELLADDLQRDKVRWQGNWIPHKIRRATEGGVFFAGDSAGHCLPLTAEGIRTALYFGLACGDQLRKVVDGHAERDEALASYASFSRSHDWKFAWMLRAQNLVPRIPPRLLGPVLKAVSVPSITRWAFDHYLRIAPP